MGGPGDDEMNSDIEKVVEIIEQRILNLQQIKSMLLAEFGVTAAKVTSDAATIARAGARVRIAR